MSDEILMNLDEIETLIRLVKRNPAIYDRAHHKHNDLNFVKDTWTSIAEEMEHPVQKVRMKWKSLRDSYRMKLYKKLQGIDNGQAWPFYVQMSFLEEHMRGRKNLCASINKKSMKRERENEDSNFVNSTTISYRNSLNNIEMVTVEDFDPSVLDSIDNSACETSTDSNRLEVSQPIKTMLASTEMEEDRCFFESLLPYMKKLSPKDKMLCRMRIQEIVYSIAFPETPNRNIVKDDS